MAALPPRHGLTSRETARTPGTPFLLCSPAFIDSLGICQGRESGCGVPPLRGGAPQRQDVSATRTHGDILIKTFTRGNWRGIIIGNLLEDLGSITAGETDQKRKKQR